VQTEMFSVTPKTVHVAIRQYGRQFHVDGTAIAGACRSNVLIQ